MMNFPFGKSPFAILLAAVVSGLVLFSLNVSRSQKDRPDLVLLVFSQVHYKAYEKILPEYEKSRGVKVQLRQNNLRAMQSRLQAAIQAGIDDVPDLVEFERTTIGFWMRGPLDGIKFIDLTDRIEAEGLNESMVESRFSLWTSRGHKFGLPHDVHPVVLVYRRDLIEEWGIDISKIKTWDDFIEMARNEIPRHVDGDDIVDHYALEMNLESLDIFEVLMLQKGIDIFDKDGNPIFDQDETIDLMEWYVKNAVGEDRIGFSTGGVFGGQRLAQTIADGLVLFYFCPDWRTRRFSNENPAMAGKLAVMPLPAWEEGARRTSVWGGTGLFITEHCENRGKADLAWDLAKFLYTNRESQKELFLDLNILPPFKEVWTDEAFQQPNEYYSNQPLGKILSELAPETPPNFINAFYAGARERVLAALVNASNYYRNKGDEGLRDYIRQQLAAEKSALLREINHNRFYRQQNQETKS